MGGEYNLHVLVPTRVASSDSLQSGSMDHTHHHFCTNAGHQGSCLTQHNLAQLQEQLSLYRADTRATFSSQEVQHKDEAEVAQNVGSDLPKSSAQEYTAMTPMNHYKEEQKSGMGPWAAESRRS
jgi:hypothetical protein